MYKGMYMHPPNCLLSFYEELVFFIFLFFI
jgi:hypothetical protein